MAREAEDRRPLLLIEQEAIAPAGHLLDWLRKRSIAHRSVSASAGESIPPPDGFRAVIALGSERHAYDDHIAWVRDELDSLAAAVNADVPVLGICFGGQALARVLGAEVTRAPETEIGWLDVGSERPEIVPSGPWFSWHSDQFALPDGAALLARNSHSIQAFALGRHLGVQFHPEVTPAIIADWVLLAMRQGVIGADAAQDQLRGVSTAYAAARANAFALFDAWWDGAIAGAGSSARDARLRSA